MKREALMTKGTENPALFKTRASSQQPIERKHNGCDNVILRLSRIRLVRGDRRRVYVCNYCDYEEEQRERE